MNHNYKKSVFIGLFLILSVLFQSYFTGNNDLWPEVKSEMRPWTRWWWMGNAVDKENISDLLKKYAAKGFGGVEITPIYGAKGYEDKYIDFLSPKWMDMLHYTIIEAGKSGMGVDMNLGTGWPFGGPQITPEYAAGKLIVRKYLLDKGQRLKDKIIVNDPEQAIPGVKPEALVAYNDNGKILQLSHKVSENGTLNWVPVAGRWELYAAFCGKTRQRVKRAAPGGEGYTMDPFSKQALDTYLKRFNDAFRNFPGIRCYFNDSYEVYNANWSPGFFQEFKQHRGYNLRNYIRELISDEPSELVSRIKSDYRQTMAEMLPGNSISPWINWAHTKNSLTKYQAHGSPGNLIDLYAAADIPECEIFGHDTYTFPGLRIDSSNTRNGQSSRLMLKIATSAAHVAGKQLISNETFTWLGEHFKVALSQCKPEVEEAFLAGINHVFYHGTTYSPIEARWPGWLFYASVNFSPSNSFWPHISGLNEYITRCQSILQSGNPDNEILIYWPVFDIWSNPKGMEMQFSVNNVGEWLKFPGLGDMFNKGYSFDFISDNLLQKSSSINGRLITSEKSVPYKALIIPACKYIPLKTFEKAVALAKSGAIIILQKLPDDVPGLYKLDNRRQALNTIIKTLQFNYVAGGVRECKLGKGAILLSENPVDALTYKKIRGEKINNYGLLFTRRTVDDGKYYYLVNHTASAIDTVIPLNMAANSVVIMDPQNGSCGMAGFKSEKANTKVRVQLLSGETLFLRLSNRPHLVKEPWKYTESTGIPMQVDGKWTLHFTRGGPVLPKTVILDHLVPWTTINDSNMLRFSGSAEYSVNFNMPVLKGDSYALDLGKLYESARVWLNGHDLGIFWSAPFRAEVGQYLHKGENTLKIEVTNLMANRIRYMDRHGIKWRNYHEINFVNVHYKPFDASGWPVLNSGLEGPVRIIPLKKSDAQNL